MFRRAVVAVIIRANASREKAPALVELRGCPDELLLLIRLAKKWRVAIRRVQEQPGG